MLVFSDRVPAQNKRRLISLQGAQERGGVFRGPFGGWFGRTGYWGAEVAAALPLVLNNGRAIH